MITPARFETYMRRVAAVQYQSQTIGPFELYFHPNNSLRYFNYAKPLRPAEGDLRSELDALKAAYVARRRLPRFEFIEEFVPELAAALEDGGFEREARQSLMVCEKAEFRTIPEPGGLVLERVNATSPEASIRTYLEIQEAAFMDGTPAHIDEQRIQDQRQSLSAGTSAFLTYVQGQPASVAATTLPLDGLSELVGVATTPSLQRKGSGTAVSSAAVAAAFDCGAEAVFLVAEDERAGQIYNRIGFQHRWWALSYSATA